MRENKIRAWNTYLKKIYIVDCIDFKHGLVVCYNETEKTSYEFGETDCILMQFIGRKDKNGKKIYEDDMFIDESGRTMIIKYSKEMACFIAEMVNDSKLGYPLYFLNVTEIEIIGNKYERPELLEREK